MKMHDSSWPLSVGAILVVAVLCVSPAFGQEAESGQGRKNQGSQAEFLISKMRGVGDLLEVPTQERREALVRERGKKNPFLCTLLGMATYYYEKEGNVAAATGTGCSRSRLMLMTTVRRTGPRTASRSRKGSSPTLR